MNKFLLSLILIFISCNSDKKENCKSIEAGKFSGNAIVFFHRPISGSTYELLFFPICNDISSTSEIKTNISKIKMRKGVSIVLPSDDVFFKTIDSNSFKLRLIESKDVNSIFWSINASFIYVKFSNAENTTPLSINNPNRGIEKILTFENGSKVSLIYYFSNKLRIDSLFPR